MSKVVAIGDTVQLLGWALAGVELLDAETADDVRERWSALTSGVGLVVLTADARAALPARLDSGPLWVVLPA